VVEHDRVAATPHLRRRVIGRAIKGRLIVQVVPERVSEWNLRQMGDDGPHLAYVPPLHRRR
jgi:hypothetical protein